MTDYVNQIGTPGLGGELLNIHGVASTFAMDTSESPEAEQAGWVLIEEAMARVDVLRQRQPLPKPAAGSPMAAVDLRSPLQPMSYHLKTFDMVAIDNLRAISKYIQETKDVPQMALYSMIRSAVESTSSGLWLGTAEGLVDSWG